MDDFAPTITLDDAHAQDAGLATPQQPVLDADAPQAAQGKLPPGASWGDDGSVDLTLLRPVVINVRSNGTVTPETYAGLQFRPLNGKQLLGAMNGKPEDRVTTLICASAGLSGLRGQMIVEQLDARDLVKATEIVGVFTDSGRPSGP